MLRLVFAAAFLTLVSSSAIVVAPAVTIAQEQPQPPQTPIPPHECHRKPPPIA